MKISHLLLTGLLAVSASYVSAQAPQPTPENPNSAAQADVTPEEIAALQALQQALAAALTPEEKSQILADAIAQTPTLASKSQLLSSVQTTAISYGVSAAQFDAAVITGLSNAQTPAAGPGGNNNQQPGFQPVNLNSTTGGSGGSPS